MEHIINNDLKLPPVASANLSAESVPKLPLINGFEPRRTVDISELGGQATEYIHQATGATLYILKNSDPNRTFSICFRTPPENSKGIPHILEHAALSSSVKYPLKEMFGALSQASIHTHLNAGTGAVATKYTIASMQPGEFLKLQDAYLDAVFHPLLTDDTLKRESWHWAPDPNHTTLVRKGVVLNEMREKESSSDSAAYREVLNVLMKDTPFAYHAGGVSDDIGQVTPDEVRGFHGRYYTAQNCFIYVYGDVDVNEQLSILDHTLLKAPQGAPFTSEIFRKKLEHPVIFESSFPTTEKIIASQSATTRLSWYVDFGDDFIAEKAIHLLWASISIGSFSPLGQKLLSSGLGTSLAGSGWSRIGKGAIYELGLVGTDPEDANKIESLVLETLTQLVSSGIPRTTLLSQIESIDLAYRRNSLNDPARGLQHFHQQSSWWINRGDVLYSSEQGGQLSSLKILRGKVNEAGYFENLLKETFLNNPERVTHSLRLTQAEDAKASASFKRDTELVGKMSHNEILSHIRDAERLDELSTQAEAPEALATIHPPDLANLGNGESLAPVSIHTIDEHTVYHAHVNTNGIAYVEVVFDLQGIETEDLPWVNLLADALVSTGTKSKEWPEFAREMRTHTGGIYGTPRLITNRFTGEIHEQFALVGSADLRNLTQLSGILKEILTEANFANTQQLKSMIETSIKNRKKSLAESPREAAEGRVNALISLAGNIEDKIYGLGQQAFLESLLERLESGSRDIELKLENLKNRLLQDGSMSFRVSCLSEELPLVLSSLKPIGELSKHIELAPRKRIIPPIDTEHTFEPVGSTGYAVLGVPLPRLSPKMVGFLTVANAWLTDEYLWNEIRLKGGAYGAGIVYQQTSNSLLLSSWSDPNPAQSLRIFKTAGDILLNSTLSENQIRRGIIGAISRTDSPSWPDVIASRSIASLLTGYGEKERLEIRAAILNTSALDLRLIGEILVDAMPNAHGLTISPKHEL